MRMKAATTEKVALLREEKTTTGMGGLYAVGRFNDWNRRIVCSQEIPRLG